MESALLLTVSSKLSGVAAIKESPWRLDPHHLGASVPGGATT
jgi:hypothetical protein